MLLHVNYTNHHISLTVAETIPINDKHCVCQTNRASHANYVFKENVNIFYWNSSNCCWLWPIVTQCISTIYVPSVNHWYITAKMMSWHEHAFCIIGSFTGEIFSLTATNVEIERFLFVRLNTLLNKQVCCWWFETHWYSCDIIVMYLNPTNKFPIAFDCNNEARNIFWETKMCPTPQQLHCMHFCIPSEHSLKVYNTVYRCRLHQPINVNAVILHIPYWILPITIHCQWFQYFLKLLNMGHHSYHL